MKSSRNSRRSWQHCRNNQKQESAQRDPRALFLSFSDMKRLLFTLSAILLVACSDESAIQPDNMTMRVLASGEKLSKQHCDEDNLGELLFVRDSAEVFFCDGESWEPLKGDDGKDGKPGIQGEKGDTGEQGVQGEKGDTGEQGIQGEKGDKGDPGDQGIPGDPAPAEDKCEIVSDKNGVLTLQCGTTVATINMATCGNMPFNPDSAYCATSDTTIPTIMKYGLLKDPRDGNVYRTATFGEATWMVDNLRYTDSIATPSLANGRTKCDGDCVTDGATYTWAAMIDSVGLIQTEKIICGNESYCELPETVRGVCPKGWHVPNLEESRALVNTWEIAEVHSNSGKLSGASIFVLKKHLLQTGFFPNTSDANLQFWIASIMQTADSRNTHIIDRHFKFNESYVFLEYNASFIASNMEHVRCVKDAY
mgnify:CR=1 FL=1